MHSNFINFMDFYELIDLSKNANNNSIIFIILKIIIL